MTVSINNFLYMKDILHNIKKTIFKIIIINYYKLFIIIPQYTFRCIGVGTRYPFFIIPLKTAKLSPNERETRIVYIVIHIIIHLLSK